MTDPPRYLIPPIAPLPLPIEQLISDEDTQVELLDDLEG